MKKGWFICIGIVAVLFPIVIQALVYNPSCVFSSIPGKDETWMGFWASYSGTIATLLVAFLTWQNSSKIEKLQEQYYELDTSANIRLNEVSIMPIVKEKGTLNRYRIKIVFDNMAKRLIHDMTIADSEVTVTIGSVERKVLEVFEYKYFLQVNQSVMQFEIDVSDDAIKKAFAGFCYYYSQFPPGIPKMKIEMTMQIQYGEEEKAKENSIEKYFEATLLPSPVIKRKEAFNITADKYLVEAYEILVEKYKVRSVHKSNV